MSWINLQQLRRSFVSNFNSAYNPTTVQMGIFLCSWRIRVYYFSILYKEVRVYSGLYSLYYSPLAVWWIASQIVLSPKLHCWNVQIFQGIIEPNSNKITSGFSTASLCLSINCHTNIFFIFFHYFCRFTGLMEGSEAMSSESDSYL